MKDFLLVLHYFFIHKDYLPDASQIPGTLFTPMHIIFEILVLLMILAGTVYVSRHKHLVKPVFRMLFLLLVGFEVGIDAWDSLAGACRGFDFSISLPLYPCSIFMYTLPLVIWGRGVWKQMACGYICTLGLVGALINFIYPISRLMGYSCISFPGLHTFFYHGSMLFAALVLYLSGIHQPCCFSQWWRPLLASIPGLVVSIPANLVNYSPVHADYMYFTGQHMLSKMVFGEHTAPIVVTLLMYAVYLLGPPLFYWIPWCCKRGYQLVWEAVSINYQPLEESKSTGEF